MRTQVADWYDTPLYYDIIFDQDTGKEASFLEQIMEQHAPSPGLSSTSLRILEPACGSGRLVAELARRGHRVSGFDLNPRMLAYTRQRLRRRKLSAQLWEDRLESFSLPSGAGGTYDLAHCLVSTFKYVLTTEGAASHLQNVAAALRPGGLYVLGLHLTDYRNERPEHERWTGSRDGVSVICNTHTWPPDRVTRTEKLRTRLRITRQGETWAQETHWQFRTYNAPELKRLLRAAPDLTLIACHDFTYDSTNLRALDGGHADVLLVLRKGKPITGRAK